MNISTVDPYFPGDELTFSSFWFSDDPYSMSTVHPSCLEGPKVSQHGFQVFPTIGVTTPPLSLDNTKVINSFHNDIRLDLEHVPWEASSYTILPEQCFGSLAEYSNLSPVIQEGHNHGIYPDTNHQIDLSLLCVHNRALSSSLHLGEIEQSEDVPSVDPFQFVSYNPPMPPLDEAQSHIRREDFNCTSHPDNRNIKDIAYKCPFPQCSKTFTRRQSWQLHQVCHSDEKPYSCKYCEKHFARKHDMKRHTRKHTGEQPYQCTFCKKGFARPDARKRHYQYENECLEALNAVQANKKQRIITS
ncbi:hypothetical protein K7432_014487 [Basidiobolus ranarum]|uniref:C2H2-type domain-containing protein n=1 Tax=Basidiobolus ranarum TaxID=34480 RepID=A0ABR2WHH6_9FUNG